MSSKRVILVTGASGNIGSQLISYLSQHAGNDVEIHAAVRDPSKAKSVAANVKFVPFDSAKAETVNAAFKGVDSAFLLLPFVEEAQAMLKTYVAAAKASGVKFVVKSSAINADANSPYTTASDHAAQEKIVKDSGIPTTVIQPTYFSDNLRWQADAIKCRGEFYGAGGDGKFSPIDTSEIAEIAGKILLQPQEHIGQTYVLTGPELVTYHDEANLFSKYLGKPIKFVSMPVDKYNELLVSLGQSKWAAEAIAGLEDIILKGYGAVIDPSAAKLLGHKQKTVEEWIAANVALFK